MAITSEMVRSLREKTGAGMMDCKKALTETNADLEKSVDWLRKKGLSAAAKKLGRITADGLIGAIKNGNSGVCVEVNAETDFVAKNEYFQKYVRHVMTLALKNFKNFDSFKKLPYGTGRSVEEELTYLVTIIGENMNLRRATEISVKEGVVCSYIHNAEAENLGKIGVLVALESTASKEKLENLAKKISMHVAAARPIALSIKEVPADAVERERQIFSEQAKASGKPEAVIEKMVEGRIRKYYEEVVLLEQGFVMDPKKKIKDVLAKASQEFGAPVELSSYVRFELGEGIEKKQEDFAAEVAAQLRK